MATTASPNTPVASTRVMASATLTPHSVTSLPASPPMPQPEFVSPPPNVQEYWDIDTDDVEPSWKDEGEDLVDSADLVVEYHSMDLVVDNMDVDTAMDYQSSKQWPLQRAPTLRWRAHV
ncbi:hypothetical protein GUJ93_ZPchr0003g16968 [Zizania palustris]|uniref:Uncharacterized protein n=1 Tax=Zizania palustris TaxID=103762 RepID=A0A8J5SEA3_ZIZPA|nr:hypothetical protein GUJ93_ZPchr0003g16968 [Zizania palustris]